MICLACTRSPRRPSERLDASQHYITFTPPRRDDDDAQIVWAKLQLRLGHECYVVTNDNWDDHRRSGECDREGLGKVFLTKDVISETLDLFSIMTINALSPSRRLSVSEAPTKILER
jgi:hypothetical protein